MLLNFKSLLGFWAHSNFSIVVMVIIIRLNSEVNVMEDLMGVSGFTDSWNSVGLLLDIFNSFWPLSDEWNFIGDCVLFNFVGSKFLCGFDNIWNLNHSSVWFLVLNNIWFINGDLEWNLLPIGLREGFLD